MPVLYLSYFFKKNRSDYYQLLQSIRDNGQWEDWIKFFLRGVGEVSKEATETCRSIVNLREKHREVITQYLGQIVANALKIIEHMYQRPILSVNDAQKILAVSYPAANSLMKALETEGILEEITGQTRNRLYKYSKYVEMFS